jgi:hypothetical protein
MINMKVKVYVNWSDETIMNEQEFQKLWKSTAAEVAEEDDALQDFLVDDKNMSIADVFRMTEGEKAELVGEFKKYCMDYAWITLVDEGCISQEEIEV